MKTLSKTTAIQDARHYLFVLALLVLALAPGLANAQVPITSLYNTGVDDNGATLNNGKPNGSVDLHYSIVSGPATFYKGGFTGGLAYTTVPNPLWWQGPLDAEWVNPVNNGSNGSAYAPQGTYDYQTTFYLKEDCIDLDTQTVVLQGNFAADDAACIWVNGTNTGQCTTGFAGTETPFKITGGTGLFVLGINRLDFVVQNTPSGNSPTGLLVEITGSVH